MQGNGKNKHYEWCVGCAGLAGHDRELIVFSDVVGLVVVFPVTATAVLRLPQIEQLGTALDAYLDGRL